VRPAVRLEGHGEEGEQGVDQGLKRRRRRLQGLFSSVVLVGGRSVGWVEFRCRLGGWVWVWFGWVGGLVGWLWFGWVVGLVLLVGGLGVLGAAPVNVA
jgi:hypothetical protein